jgi:pimeloyl-ACP methyl ester carboxylesterase
MSLAELAEQVHHVLDHVGGGPAVVLGHSMGAAVAVQVAHAHPESTLGLLLRDGVATPAWKVRRGLVPSLLSPISPDVATFVDVWAAMVLDLPDLAVGRLYSTLRSMLPDIGYSLRTVGRTLPVGGVLMDVDLRPQLGELAADGLPILPVWGCFDRVVGDNAAADLARAARTRVQWVPGGHSWMLARPQGQADLLTHVPSGQAFVAAVTARWRGLQEPTAGLRPAI